MGTEFSEGEGMGEPIGCLIVSSNALQEQFHLLKFGEDGSAFRAQPQTISTFVNDVTSEFARRSGAEHLEAYMFSFCTWNDVRGAAAVGKLISGDPVFAQVPSGVFFFRIRVGLLALDTLSGKVFH
jgi:hypothetical protein